MLNYNQLIFKHMLSRSNKVKWKCGQLNPQWVILCSTAVVFGGKNKEVRRELGGVFVTSGDVVGVLSYAAQRS